MPQMTEACEWPGRKLVGWDGEKIGTVSEIYLDVQTDEPEWATVTSGLFGAKYFVPLAGASMVGEDVRAPVTKDQVRTAPSVGPGGQLSEQEEMRLFEHYGIPYTPEGSVTAEGQPKAEGRKELRIGTRSQESSRVRLRKHIVAEQVTKAVQGASEPRQGDRHGRA
jgi:PRC-barrel domain protein